MKRIVLIFMMLIPLIGMAQKSPVDDFFKKYVNKEGFTTVNMSGTLFAHASGTYNIHNDNAKGDLLEGVSNMRIITVEDDDLKGFDFYKALGGADFFEKNGYEILMEVVEDVETVRFYGCKGKHGKLSELLFIVSGNGNSLISVRGEIDLQNLNDIAKALDVRMDAEKK